MTKPMGPTGVCPDCFGRFAIKFNGTLRTHRTEDCDADGVRRTRCAGSSQPPQPGSEVAGAKNRS